MKKISVTIHSFIFIQEVFLMAKAKLTLKQEADMLSAVNQIKELEAAGKKLKKGNGGGHLYRTVHHCCQQPVRQPCISGDTPVPL